MKWSQPLRFVPVYQTRVWGGRNLESQFGRQLPDSTQPYGESWEMSDRPEALSLVREGEAHGMSLHDLWINHRQAVFGRGLLDHPAERYPLLIKILDACDDLSIQVHPPAEVAEELKGEPKTEMWYIIQAQPSARLYAGLRAGVSREDFQQALHDGTTADLMHYIEPQGGDCLFLPSGRVHAIGAGLVIFEIQQNSDTTYRVFDWNRTGLDGKPRALHIEESLKSIDFDDHEPGLQDPSLDGTLVSCEYFKVRHQDGGNGFSLGEEGENLTVAVIRGSLVVNNCTLAAGDFAVIPAAMTATERTIFQASADSQWLEISIPVP
ncbi:mannose-6-phosphate isomerase, type 1 [Prosthecobacter debontii]|uniref:Mannose-6-phosphate isomerase, type 1 n=1 Tax=Prosthecobacter debontii TaxID=48467 RepID=A0A1T4XKK8_9BACT|nr:type I phosphomannose isomerase catalytic subunit [Prosthecobacter debontii]SKA90119.1 mannose-6-phosphate isomerase, type 1 [Prosthecobacter debontii]